MDSVTGHSFISMNRTLHHNFNGATTLSSAASSDVVQFFSSSKSMQYKLFKNASEIIQNLFVAGSLVEGGALSSLDMTGKGSRQIDMDLMVEFPGVSLSVVEQIECIQDVCGAPGYVLLETNNRILNLPDAEDFTVEIEGKVYISTAKIKNLTEAFFVYLPESNRPVTGPNQASLRCKTFPHFIELLQTQGCRSMQERRMESEFPECSTAEISEMIEQCNRYDANLMNQSCNMDIVPCIGCEYWPLVQAQEWIYRHRLWPPEDIVENIATGGYHLVPKASHGVNTEIEWRISFSKAELTLAQNRNPVQQKCFYIFKTLIAERHGVTDIIKTYHLKTLMMWAMESRPAEYWREDNLSQCVLGLLNDLLHAVSMGCLPHYFIPQNNLFNHLVQTSLEQEAKLIAKLITDISNINRHRPLPVCPKLFNYASKLIGNDATEDNLKAWLGNMLNRTHLPLPMHLLDLSNNYHRLIPTHNVVHQIGENQR